MPRHATKIQDVYLLLCLAEGMTRDEIGEERNCSTHPINLAIGNLRAAMGAKNDAHLVALAYHEGLLLPRKQLRQELESPFARPQAKDAPPRPQPKSAAPKIGGDGCRRCGGDLDEQTRGCTGCTARHCARRKRIRETTTD